MSESNGAADAAAVVPPSAQGTDSPGQVTNADAAATTNGAEDAPFISKREFVDLAKTVRALKAELAEAKGSGRKPEAKADPSAALEQRLADLDFRELVADVAPGLTRAQRQLLNAARRADSPQDPETWVREQVTALGWDKPATPATQAAMVPQAKQATNPGAPGVGGRGIDPQSLAKADWAALSGDSLREAWKGLVERDPTTGNKFAPRKR